MRKRPITFPNEAKRKAGKLKARSGGIGTSRTRYRRPRWLEFRHLSLFQRLFGGEPLDPRAHNQKPPEETENKRGRQLRRPLGITKCKSPQGRLRPHPQRLMQPFVPKGYWLCLIYC